MMDPKLPQTKFLLADRRNQPVFVNDANAKPLEVDFWDTVEAQPVLEGDAWESYLAVPFSGHADYIAALRRIALDYPDFMGRKNDKGIKMLEVLRNGSRSRHFYYLYNASVFRRLHHGPLPVGTTQNGALHAQIRSWTTVVHRKHRDTLELASQIFALYKSLAWHLETLPMMRGMRESRAISVIAGLLERESSDPEAAPKTPTATTINRCQLKQALAPLSGTQLSEKAAMKQEQAASYQKQIKIDAARAEGHSAAANTALENARAPDGRKRADREADLNRESAKRRRSAESVLSPGRR